MNNEKELIEALLEGWGIEDKVEIICPNCGSKRISRIDTYQIWQEINLSSGRILNKRNKLSPYCRVFHTYKCRKCEWQSINFDE